MGVDQFQQALVSAGRLGFHLAFPNDLEYYLVTLELSTFEGEILEAFTFPINPSSVSERDNISTSVKKTSKSVTAIQNPTFHPVDITLSGTFGTGIKLMLGRVIVPFIAVSLEDQEDYQKRETESIDAKFGKEFNKIIKTGYGASRVLRRLVYLSRQGNDKSYILRYYNQASGSNYIAVITDHSISMNEGRNFLWDYSLSLKGIAYADDFRFGTVTTTARAGQFLLLIGAQVLARQAQKILLNVLG